MPAQPTRPPTDSTTATDVPLTHTERPERATGVPCRAHLYATLFSVAYPARNRVRWEVPAHLWELIKTDPELRAEWIENHIQRRPTAACRTLIGRPVDVLDQATLDHIRLIVTIDCNPPEV